ncbi:hypothetical protein EMIT079MI2_110048 [Bacillus sp. IT-79MI2]
MLLFSLFYSISIHLKEDFNFCLNLLKNYIREINYILLFHPQFYYYKLACLLIIYIFLKNLYYWKVIQEKLSILKFLITYYSISFL